MLRVFQILEPLDAVLDVGGVYDPETDRYDHRQRGFDQDFGNGFVTKLSSARLVYKHYGQEIVAQELGLSKGHPGVQRVFLAVCKSFMEVFFSTHCRLARLEPEWLLVRGI